MSKPFPALCVDCKYSKPDKNSPWSLNCIHPLVNSNDPSALSSSVQGNGTDCYYERQRKFFAKCGMRGKLWEAK